MSVFSPPICNQYAMIGRSPKPPSRLQRTERGRTERWKGFAVDSNPVFNAQVQRPDLTFAQILTIILMTAISSVGTPGIPGGSIVISI